MKGLFASIQLHFLPQYVLNVLLSLLSGYPVRLFLCGQAHALTVRMMQQVEFPFLVLLVSGGHCLLAVARGINDFLRLGQTLDEAPGDIFDKVLTCGNILYLLWRFMKQWCCVLVGITVS